MKKTPLPKALWFQIRQESPRTRREPLPAIIRAKERKAFLEACRESGMTCPVVAAIPELRNGFKYGWPISNKITELHHVQGRRGELLNDKRHWLGVSKEGHRWIHSHPAEARKKGWLCEVGLWNSPDLS